MEQNDEWAIAPRDMTLESLAQLVHLESAAPPAIAAA